MEVERIVSHLGAVKALEILELSVLAALPIQVLHAQDSPDPHREKNGSVLNLFKFHLLTPLHKQYRIVTIHYIP